MEIINYVNLTVIFATQNKKQTSRFDNYSCRKLLNMNLSLFIVIFLKYIILFNVMSHWMVKAIIRIHNWINIEQMVYRSFLTRKYLDKINDYNVYIIYDIDIRKTCLLFLI